MSFELFLSPTESVMTSCVATELLEDLQDQSAFNIRLAELTAKAYHAEKARTDRLQDEVTFLRQLLLLRPEPRDNSRTVPCRFWASPSGCSVGDACTFRHDVREKAGYVRE